MENVIWLILQKLLWGMSTVWSMCGAMCWDISTAPIFPTAIIAVCLLVYDWRLALACLWGVPVAFGLLFGSRRLADQASRQTKKAAVRVSDGIQEALENVREIRATNQEERYLAGLYEKIDEHEKVMIKGELSTGLFVNAASVVMRMGVATTILVGANLILSGHIDFMLLFLFLLVITRVYAPFDQSLALIAEMFISQVSANRMNEIYDTPIAEGTQNFKPDGHDIVFDHVAFAYDKKDVLRDVSFTAKEGEITALVGPSGSGKSTCARLAARLWDVTRGSIKVGGVDISTVDPEVLLSDYSMVFQDVVLLMTQLWQISVLAGTARRMRRCWPRQKPPIVMNLSADCQRATIHPLVKTAPDFPAVNGSAFQLPGLF